MTRVQVLEDQKAIFTAQKVELENKNSDIYIREQKVMSDTLLPFFKDFNSEKLLIEVTRSSIYFKMDHPECSYKKELFSIYLRENWDLEKEGVKFKGIDLSYYSTSTKGGDTWELKRLQLLGLVAWTVLEDQEKMLDAVNEAVLPFKEEYDRVYEQMNLIGKAIREVESKISAISKEKIAFDLMNGGIQFNKGVHIQMKFNYTPHISTIKLIDVSKSGKKATAVFIWNHGGAGSQEENVSVESITKQVLGFANNIVQPSLVE